MENVNYTACEKVMSITEKIKNRVDKRRPGLLGWGLGSNFLIC